MRTTPSTVTMVLMRICTVAMRKGGTGKTTAVVSLAHLAVHEHGLRTLVVDLDDQGSSATTWLQAGNTKAAGRLLTGEAAASQLVEETPSGVWVIGGGSILTVAEREIADEPGRERILAAALEPLRGHVDLVLIDTPPSEGVLAVNGLVAADEVWAPMQPTASEMQGLPRLLQMVDKIRSRGLGGGAGITAVIPSRYQANTSVQTQGYGILVDQFGEIRHGGKVTQAVPASVKVPEAFGHRQPIAQYAGISAPAVAYRMIASQLLGAAPLPIRPLEHAGAPA